MLLKCSVTTSVDNPIVLSDDEQVEQGNVKPLILAKFSFTSEEPIVLSDTDKNPPDTPATLTIDNDRQQSSSTTDITISSVTEIIYVTFVTNSFGCRVFPWHITTNSIKMTALNASFVTIISNHAMDCLNIKRVICT